MGTPYLPYQAYLPYLPYSSFNIGVVRRRPDLQVRLCGGPEGPPYIEMKSALTLSVTRA